MAIHALTLYKGSCSTYILDGISASIDLVPESSFVREEARLIPKAPLAIMATPSYDMNGGSSLKTMARSKVPQGGAKEKKIAPTHPTTSTIKLKHKTFDVSGPSKHPVVMPSGNTDSRASSYFHITRPSPSYNVVGMRKPDGGYGKALMRKPAKKPENKRF